MNYLAESFKEGLQMGNAPHTTQEIIILSREALKGIRLPNHPVTGKKLEVDDLRIAIYQNVIIIGYFVTRDGYVFSRYIERAQGKTVTGGNGFVTRMGDSLTFKEPTAVRNQKNTIIKALAVSFSVPLDMFNHDYYNPGRSRIGISVNVHELVARAWMPFREFVYAHLSEEERKIAASSNIVINHKDQNALNNSMDNLEYLVQIHNSQKATKFTKEQEIERWKIQYAYIAERVHNGKATRYLDSLEDSDDTTDVEKLKPKPVLRSFFIDISDADHSMVDTSAI